jgi:hypothetical protein
LPNFRNWRLSSVQSAESASKDAKQRHYNASVFGARILGGG